MHLPLVFISVITFINECQGMSINNRTEYLKPDHRDMEALSPDSHQRQIHPQDQLDEYIENETSYDSSEEGIGHSDSNNLPMTDPSKHESMAMELLQGKNGNTPQEDDEIAMKAPSLQRVDLPILPRILHQEIEKDLFHPKAKFDEIHERKPASYVLVPVTVTDARQENPELNRFLSEPENSTQQKVEVNNGALEVEAIFDPSIKVNNGALEEEAIFDPSIKVNNGALEGEAIFDPSIKVNNGALEGEAIFDPSIKVNNGALEKEAIFDPSIKVNNGALEEEAIFDPSIKVNNGDLEGEAIFDPSIKHDSNELPTLGGSTNTHKHTDPRDVIQLRKSTSTGYDGDELSYDPALNLPISSGENQNYPLDEEKERLMPQYHGIHYVPSDAVQFKNAEITISDAEVANIDALSIEQSPSKKISNDKNEIPESMQFTEAISSNKNPREEKEDLQIMINSEPSIQTSKSAPFGIESTLAERMPQKQDLSPRHLYSIASSDTDSSISSDSNQLYDSAQENIGSENDNSLNIGGPSNDLSSSEVYQAEDKEMLLSNGSSKIETDVETSCDESSVSKVSDSNDNANLDDQNVLKGSTVQEKKVKTEGNTLNDEQSASLSRKSAFSRESSIIKDTDSKDSFVQLTPIEYKAAQQVTRHKQVSVVESLPTKTMVKTPLQDKGNSSLSPINKSDTSRKENSLPEHINITKTLPSHLETVSYDLNINEKPSSLPFDPSVQSQTKSNSALFENLPKSLYPVPTKFMGNVPHRYKTPSQSDIHATLSKHDPEFKTESAKKITYSSNNMQEETKLNNPNSTKTALHLTSILRETLSKTRPLNTHGQNKEKPTFGILGNISSNRTPYIQNQNTKKQHHSAPPSSRDQSRNYRYNMPYYSLVRRREAQNVERSGVDLSNYSERTPEKSTDEALSSGMTSKVRNDRMLPQSDKQVIANTKSPDGQLSSKFFPTISTYSSLKALSKSRDGIIGNKQVIETSTLLVSTSPMPHIWYDRVSGRSYGNINSQSRSQPTKNVHQVLNEWYQTSTRETLGSHLNNQFSSNAPTVRAAVKSWDLENSSTDLPKSSNGKNKGTAHMDTTRRKSSDINNPSIKRSNSFLLGLHRPNLKTERFANLNNHISAHVLKSLPKFQERPTPRTQIKIDTITDSTMNKSTHNPLLNNQNRQNGRVLKDSISSTQVPTLSQRSWSAAERHVAHNDIRNENNVPRLYQKTDQVLDFSTIKQKQGNSRQQFGTTPDQSLTVFKSRNSTNISTSLKKVSELANAINSSEKLNKANQRIQQSPQSSIQGGHIPPESFHNIKDGPSNNVPQSMVDAYITRRESLQRPEDGLSNQRSVKFPRRVDFDTKLQNPLSVTKSHQNLQPDAFHSLDLNLQNQRQKKFHHHTASVLTNQRMNPSNSLHINQRQNQIKQILKSTESTMIPDTSTYESRLRNSRKGVVPLRQPSTVRSTNRNSLSWLSNLNNIQSEPSIYKKSLQNADQTQYGLGLSQNYHEPQSHDSLKYDFGDNKSKSNYNGTLNLNSTDEGIDLYDYFSTLADMFKDFPPLDTSSIPVTSSVPFFWDPYASINPYYYPFSPPGPYAFYGPPPGIPDEEYISQFDSPRNQETSPEDQSTLDKHDSSTTYNEDKSESRPLQGLNRHKSTQRPSKTSPPSRSVSHSLPYTYNGNRKSRLASPEKRLYTYNNPISNVKPRSNNKNKNKQFTPNPINYKYKNYYGKNFNPYKNPNFLMPTPNYQNVWQPVYQQPQYRFFPMQRPPVSQSYYNLLSMNRYPNPMYRYPIPTNWPMNNYYKNYNNAYNKNINNNIDKNDLDAIMHFVLTKPGYRWLSSTLTNSGGYFGNTKLSSVRNTNNNPLTEMDMKAIEHFIITNPNFIKKNNGLF